MSNYLAFKKAEEMVGARLSARLIGALGGLHLHIPERLPDQNHRIVLALGSEDAEAICALIGRWTINIPHRKRAGPPSRASLVLKLLEQGKTSREIAHELGMTQRNASKIIGDHYASIGERKPRGRPKATILKSSSQPKENL